MKELHRFLENVFIATDDERIFDHVKCFTENAIMTSKEHSTGTERVREASKIIQKTIDFDIVINIQGDEPFLSLSQIKTIKTCFLDSSVKIATLIKQINSNEELFNTNIPKVIKDIHDNAIYFSRQTIPYLRNSNQDKWLEEGIFYKHIGIYAYCKNTLEKITKISPSLLENSETLEQNRWIENGYKIKTAVTYDETIAVDTPEDIILIKEKGMI